MAVVGDSGQERKQGPRKEGRAGAAWASVGTTGGCCRDSGWSLDIGLMPLPPGISAISHPSVPAPLPCHCLTTHSITCRISASCVLSRTPPPLFPAHFPVSLSWHDPCLPPTPPQQLPDKAAPLNGPALPWLLAPK